ncbi:twin-arginine translocase TatA/TatE family subunit [Myxococcota bacterium]|nr:twin-arginine translocase TatA/TatE family subunit [Myxococcota bacterium]
MFGIGMMELVVIFAIALLVLGPKRLPALARSLGRTLAEFRRASTDLRQEFMDVEESVKIMPDDPRSSSSSDPMTQDREGEDPKPDASPTAPSEPATAGQDVGGADDETPPAERSTSGGSRG